MTVASSISSVEGLGNGAAFVFPFSPMVIYASTDLEVTHVSIAGVETVLTEGEGAANYAVTVALFPGTGSVTYPADSSTAMATGEKVIMKKVLTLEQSTNLENQGGYNPEVLETQLDKLVGIDIQQQEEIDRSVTLPISSAASAVLPTPSAGALLGWAADALSIENKADSSALIGVPGASTDNAVLRFNGTAGTSFQDSGVLVDDSDNLTVPGTISIAGIAADSAAGTSRATLGVDHPVVSGGAVTLAAADRGEVYRVTSTATVILTAAATLGADWFAYVKADGGVATIDPDGSETIDGATTLVLQDGDSVIVFCNGTSFFTLNRGVGDTLSVDTLTDTSSGLSTGVENLIDGAAKVWGVRSEDASPTLDSSFNVASLTDNGTGDTTFNYTNDMASAAYAATAEGGMDTVTGNETAMCISNLAAGSVRMVTETAGAAAADRVVHMLTLGDLA